MTLGTAQGTVNSFGDGACARGPRRSRTPKEGGYGHDRFGEPVRYMDRTRLYYRALGYSPDYLWAHFDEVPFARLSRPLSGSRIALVTTASPADRHNRDARGVKHVWSGSVAAPPDGWFTDDLAWDKESTHMRDRESFLPIEAAETLAADGMFAGLTQHFHGIPTEYSHRKTMQEDAPALLSLLRDERADGVLLFPI
jgi:D-proline reductase (dithiol) PrdB